MIRFLTGWKGYAAAALLAFGVGWVINGWRQEAQLARLEAAHAVLLKQQAQAVVASVQAARNEEKRRTAAVEKERDIAIEQNEALAADVAAGRTVSERLRSQLAALRASAGSGDPTAAERGQGQPSSDPIGMLIDMYAGLDEAGREVAEYADRLRIAGLACEKSYDRVRLMPHLVQ